jgi:hypothetical protein
VRGRLAGVATGQTGVRVAGWRKVPKDLPRFPMFWSLGRQYPQAYIELEGGGEGEMCRSLFTGGLPIRYHWT